ncbi:MAG: DUF4160 domain-containing protein [Tannerella sp.]|jgi:hypothetical protein|nr:DUF4160 domain-containing protein [Tannerella sp.]
MPKLLIIKSFVFFIWMQDLMENRRHVHVVKNTGRKFKAAKIWLEPEICLAHKGSFSEKELKEILNIASDNKTQLINNISKIKELWKD